MAAYGALVSLTNIVDHILHPPPGHQFTIVREQIESVRAKVLLLLDFLENHSCRRSKEIEDLETRIADAVYAAEDVIESNVITQILAAKSATTHGVKKSFTLLCQKVLRRILSTEKKLVLVKEKKDIPMIIEEFISIEKELMKINDKRGVEDLQPKISKIEASSSAPLQASGKSTMVGFEEHLIQVMSALTTDESNLQIIPIVGMGGIGKTTLATNVYNNPFIAEHFQIRAWFAVSQEYTEKEILLGLLDQISNAYRNKRDMDDRVLGEKLHKELFGRKYLIVMDDMWDIKAWEMVKGFLPNNNNGSRILVTTRQLNLAVDIGSCSPYKLNFLDEAQSWDLLREKIFPEECCPVELEVIGKNIGKKCRGLPLALVVIGGLLAKSKKTSDHWKYVEEDVTAVVNNQDDEFCMKILSLSYNHLPIYLKPCFLYLAVFPEDFEIQVSRLVKLWVAEGFIKQNRPASLEKSVEQPKSLEKIAEEHLEDLIDRNLILVRKRRVSGEAKTCHIHDILRDLCKREAQKDNFLCIAELDNNTDITPYKEIVRRLSIHGRRWKHMMLKASRAVAPTRSFLSYSSGNSSSVTTRQFRLLRVLDVLHGYTAGEILQLINLRYVACMGQKLMSSSISRLWSLQTIVVDADLYLPREVWQMPQLRHVEARRIFLPDPPHAQTDGQRIIVLENLQTLSTVEDFKCTEKVIERIPNVKKLKITCGAARKIGSFCLSNLGVLHKLESLGLTISGTLGNIVFPSSLKKLTLSEFKIPWEDMSIIGLLPNLEVLKLRNAAVGQKWIPNEGEFIRLKFLLIHQCELEIWEADNMHFPCLEQLHLGYLSLKEISVDFAEILSLQVIDLNHCSNSLLESVKGISEQRENLGYEAIQVRNYIMGLLRIRVKRGINLAAAGIRSRDPYLVVRMGKQRLKTRYIKKDINPEWNEDLTMAVSDPSHPVFLTVYDRNAFGMNEMMGDAEFDVRPFIEALKIHPDGLPNGTVIRRIQPAMSNCLAEESSVVWTNGRVIQEMCLRLKNVECGEVELQLQWIYLPGSKGL